MFLVAVPAFGVHIRVELLPAAFVTLVLGGVAFTALGFAVASYVRRADTAPIVANLTLFPLLFVSGVFYSVEGRPEWIERIADVFPLSHLVRAFDACFSPYTTGAASLARPLVAPSVGSDRGVRRSRALLTRGDRRGRRDRRAAAPGFERWG